VNFCGLSFVISDNKILNTIRTNNTVTASLGVNDAHCDLYDDYYGVPGNLLFSSNTLSSAIATGYNTWTGFTYPLIAMKKYWAVWKNLNGVPGTNFFSVNVAPGIEPWFPASGNWAWQKATSVNSGTSWTQAAGVGLRLGFSDGTYVGMLCNGGASSLDIGSQNDNLIYDFYSGSGATRTKLGTTGPIPRQLVSLSTPSWVPAYFVPQFGGNNPAVNMTPGQSYTVVAHGDGNYKSQFGSKFTCPANVSPNVRGIAMLFALPGAGAGFRINSVSFDSDANSIPTFPIDGTAIYTQSLDGGSSFTDTQGLVLPFMVLLDTNGPFASSGGFGEGGGIWSMVPADWW
jgi:hypothetical protein